MQWLLEKRFLALSSLKAGVKSGLVLLKHWLLNRRPASTSASASYVSWSRSFARVSVLDISVPFTGVTHWDSA